MAFVGRAAALSRLLGRLEQAREGRAGLVLVSGEAGIGKTTLIGEAAARSGVRVGWGTCVDADRAPAFWPWTTALRALLAESGSVLAPMLSDTDTETVSRLLPELADDGAAERARDPRSDPDAARLRLFDAVARLLEQIARDRPAMVVLDDLQWADPSTLELLHFVTRPYRPVPLLVVGAYRHDELTGETARAVAELDRVGEAVRLRGLSPAEVVSLVTDTAGPAAAERWASEVHRRTGGHPLFARQLGQLLADPDRSAAAVPDAISDLVARKVQRLSADGQGLVRAGAVAGNALVPDVLAEVCETDATGVAALMDEGVVAGLLVRDATTPGCRFAHDVFRESIAARLPAVARIALHQRVADALEHRHARGAAVVPADLSRHCTAAVPLDGPDRAVRWAREAAGVERARLAFAEAAEHLARARRAVEDAGTPDAGPTLLDLLVEEADARGRSGDPAAARSLLDDAWSRAVRARDAERIGRVALGFQRLGARFAMPREAVVGVLEDAVAAVQGTGTSLEAQLAAALARELRHSVPAERPRAGPLSERAVTLARELDDPGTLAACLLAAHDVLWTPGRSAERLGVAREITELATRGGDAELYAEGRLLTANALLEEGSAAFRSVLTEFLAATERFGQPRHDYLALTRRGALALVDGRLADARQMIDEASALGERIGEPDTGNVRMSQLLGLVRAEGDPARLRATAAEAVRWWVGVPAHAHAVAAGLYALAGEPHDLVASRRALDTVVALDTWREDRSYLWPVFVGGMATAAARLQDSALCADLLEELEPVTGVSGVNGALVCYMGSNAHWAGLLAAALGRPDDARQWLEQGLAVHRRLGAVAWEHESSRELAALDDPPPAERAAPGSRRTDAELCRDGELWRVRHGELSAHLRDLKGLADLVVLLSRPGTDVHVLELVGAEEHDRSVGPVLDVTALAAYRRRLAELDEELTEAHEHADTGHVQRLDEERLALLAQLRLATGLAGRSRPLGSSTGERARKAVTARVRDAISRVTAVLPELGAHLDRSVLTGSTCRYQPTEPLTWTLRTDP